MTLEEYIKSKYTYNPETGEVIGPEGGVLRVVCQGYLRISVGPRYNIKRIYAHRMAWLLYYGEWPKQKIDHINGIKDDNRIVNLRDVSVRQNNCNKLLHIKGRLVGTYFDKRRNHWRSTIRVKGKSKHLGVYKTEQEAHDAYIAYKNECEL